MRPTAPGGYLINPDITKKEILAQSGLLKDTDLSAINAEQTQTPTPTPAEAEPNTAQGQDTKAKTKSRKSKLDFIDEEEAVFTRVHNDQYIHAKKRLYMTATPKIYGDAAKDQKKNDEVVLYSMDDTDVFGPVFHSLNFDEAVQSTTKLLFWPQTLVLLEMIIISLRKLMRITLLVLLVAGRLSINMAPQKTCTMMLNQ